MQSYVCEKEQTDPGIAFVIAKTSDGEENTKVEYEFGKRKEQRDENEKI